MTDTAGYIIEITARDADGHPVIFGQDVSGPVIKIELSGDKRVDQGLLHAAVDHAEFALREPDATDGR